MSHYFNKKLGSIIIIVIIIGVITLTTILINFLGMRVPFNKVSTNSSTTSVTSSVSNISTVRETLGGPPLPPSPGVIYLLEYRSVTLDELKYYENKFNISIPYLDELADGSKLRDIVVDVPNNRLVRVISTYTLYKPSKPSSMEYKCVR